MNKPKVYKRSTVWECKHFNAYYRFKTWTEAIAFAIRVGAGKVPDIFPIHIGMDSPKNEY
jgi:hypothetical protein